MMKNGWMSEVSRGQAVEVNEPKPLDIRLELDGDGKLAIVLNGARVSEVDLSVLLAKKPSKKSSK